MFAFMQKITTRQRLLLAALTLVSLLSIGGFFAFTQMQTTHLATGSIMVLPINMELGSAAINGVESSVEGVIEDSIKESVEESKNDDWQAYAQMEQVILALGTSGQYPVLQAEDVISMLSQASSFIGDHQAIDLNRLFTISGSSLIVESSVAFLDNHYQLDYRLLSAQKISTGSFNEVSLPALHHELAQRVQDFANLSATTNDVVQEAWFNDPLLINALKQIQYAELDDARSSLNQLLAISPNNLVAIRLLAELIMAETEGQDDNNAQQILAKSKRWLERGILYGSANASEKTHPKIIANYQRQLARLRLALAQNKLKNGELELAISELSQARILAANAQDWLYLGYISNWSGYIYQRLNRYQQAQAQYQYSLDYHRKSGYPAGQVIALNNQAKLQVLQHNYSLAYKTIQLSVALVTQKELSQLSEPTFKLLTKIENKLQRTR
ncbi:hypothetical protein ACVBIL_14960 [Shewanella sp. 125m-7]